MFVRDYEGLECKTGEHTYAFISLMGVQLLLFLHISGPSPQHLFAAAFTLTLLLSGQQCNPVVELNSSQAGIRVTERVCVCVGSSPKRLHQPARAPLEAKANVILVLCAFLSRCSVFGPAGPAVRPSPRRPDLRLLHQGHGVEPGDRPPGGQSLGLVPSCRAASGWRGVAPSKEGLFLCRCSSLFRCHWIMFDARFARQQSCCCVSYFGGLKLVNCYHLHSENVTLFQ